MKKYYLLFILLLIISFAVTAILIYRARQTDLFFAQDSTVETLQPSI